MCQIQSMLKSPIIIKTILLLYCVVLLYMRVLASNILRHCYLTYIYIFFILGGIIILLVSNNSICHIIFGIERHLSDWKINVANLISLCKFLQDIVCLWIYIYFFRSCIFRSISFENSMQSDFNIWLNLRICLIYIFFQKVLTCFYVTTDYL